jgi:hypothetical protein
MIPISESLDLVSQDKIGFVKWSSELTGGYSQGGTSVRRLAGPEIENLSTLRTYESVAERSNMSLILCDE